MHAGKIVAMQDGRIVEVGSHTDLLANRGRYYHLYKAQLERALSMPMPMPMPDEWGQEAAGGPASARSSLSESVVRQRYAGR